jgi:hypothetical protein
MYNQFISALWPNDIPSGHQLLFWMLKPSPRDPGNSNLTEKASYWFTNLASANTFHGTHIAPDANWYIRGTLVSTKLGHDKHKRGTAQDSTVIPALWLDQDIDDGRHKKGNELPKTLDEAVFMLESMPLPPSLMVLTGGGAQAWWLLVEPWIFKNIDDQHRAAALAQGWNQHLLRLCEARGWTTDSVHDLARVMRLPGTWNVKAGLGDQARATSILYPLPDEVVQRYSVEQITHALRGAETPDSGAPIPGATVPASACITPPQSAVPGLAFYGDAYAILDSLFMVPSFEEAWDRGCGSADNSLSSCEETLRRFCVDKGIKDEVVLAEILRLFRLKHGEGVYGVGKSAGSDGTEDIR